METRDFVTLYKYLDYQGGLKMLENCNYLGVNIFHRNKDKIIKAAKELNPEIKIYQMITDPEAFKLKEELIEN